MTKVRPDPAAGNDRPADPDTLVKLDLPCPDCGGELYADAGVTDAGRITLEFVCPACTRFAPAPAAAARP